MLAKNHNNLVVLKAMAT